MHKTKNLNQQLNGENRSKGGPKTPEGKDKIKFNANKHRILSTASTGYDEASLDLIHTRLLDDLAPETLTEEFIIERIALYMLRLHRVVKAETEHMRKCLDPTITKSLFDNDPLEPIVVKKGYVPEINEGDIAPLFNLYHRYEKSLENRLYRAIQELERIKKSGKD